jgi:hypothetical protein
MIIHDKKLSANRKQGDLLGLPHPVSRQLSEVRVNFDVVKCLYLLGVNIEDATQKIKNRERFFFRILLFTTIPHLSEFKPERQLIHSNILII